MTDIEKYNNYNTRHFNSVTNFVNNFYLNNNEITFFNVMCTNIRSVNANFDELLLFLENYIN